MVTRERNELEDSETATPVQGKAQQEEKINCISSTLMLLQAHLFMSAKMSYINNTAMEEVRNYSVYALYPRHIIG